mgnify:CR=1 FL=1
MTKEQLAVIAESVSVIAKQTEKILIIAKSIPEQEAMKIMPSLEKISGGNLSLMETAKEFDKMLWG